MSFTLLFTAVALAIGFACLAYICKRAFDFAERRKK